MHAPTAFRVNDTAELVAFIEARHFATLVVAGPDGPLAAHVPMLVNRDADGAVISLECHVACNNPVTAIAASGVKAPGSSSVPTRRPEPLRPMRP